jgi:hypothetical protein
LYETGPKPTSGSFSSARKSSTQATQPQIRKKIYAGSGLTALFLTGFAIVCALIGINGLVQSKTAFGKSGDLRVRQNIDLLSVADIVAAKAAHAMRRAPYEVGLFGSSRAIEVSHPDVGLQADTFFNFSVGGASFRQSVALLEYLARHERAPSLAIVSIDNHDLGFLSHVYWPLLMSLPDRLTGTVPRPSSSGLDGRPWTISRQEFLDPWVTLATQLRSHLNFTRVSGQIRFLLSPLFGDRPESNLYRPDGARPQQFEGTPPIRGFRAVDMPDGDVRLVDADMRRLADIQRKGVKIVIFESPIHPTLRTAVEQTRSENLRAFRLKFADMCFRYSIACVPAPALSDDDPWSDCCHPPPKLLGRFLSELL